MEAIRLKQGAARWDEVSLGEVMLRLDPGEGRIHTARQFTVWEGGGEYNVARGLRRCFGLKTAVATALADNAVGRLVEDLILQGGVDTSLLRWVPYDGVGRAARNGLNFTERGLWRSGGGGVFGSRAHSDCGQPAGGLGLGRDFWAGPGWKRWGRAVVPYGRNFCGAVGVDAWGCQRGDGCCAEIWDADFLRFEFSRFAVEEHWREGEGAGGESRAGAQGGFAAGERRGFLGDAGDFAARAWRRISPNCRWRVTSRCCGMWRRLIRI